MQVRHWSWIRCVVLMATAWSAASTARGQDAVLDLLVRKGIINQREANEVREQLDTENAQTIEMYNKTKVAGWIDEMKWASDFRLRGEFFDNADQGSAANAQNDRWRFRYRLRLGIETKFKEWATVGVRIASGGEDPVSTNQSFTDTFSRKEFRIDLAYLTITPPGWNWISVSGGKIKNPVWQTSLSSPMQYDGDVTPEGLSEQLVFKFGPDQRHKLFANFGQFVLDEAGVDSNDPYLLEFQAGLEANFGRTPKNPVLKATLAGGYSMTRGLELLAVQTSEQPGATNVSAVANGFQSTSPNRGNSTSLANIAGARAYLADFRDITGRGELVWTPTETPFLGTPCAFTLSGEYLQNLAGAYESLAAAESATAPDQTEGYSGQIAFGGIKKKGEWQVAYQYKYLEADATWDALTDSDWGLGGTDRKGHVVKASYNLQDWWQMTATLFLTEKISARGSSAGAHRTRGTAGEDLLRLQLDTVVKF